MADIKISQLPTLTLSEDNDVIVINDVSTSATKKITRGNFLSHITKNAVDSGDGVKILGDLVVANEIIADGDISTSGDIAFGSLTDYVNNLTVLRFVNSITDILAYDSALPTAKALSDYLTENGNSKRKAGTATVLTGTTSINVAHSFGIPPTRVSVTPAENIANARKFWASVDSTNVTISLDSNPGSDITFWYDVGVGFS